MTTSKKLQAQNKIKAIDVDNFEFAVSDYSRAILVTFMDGIKEIFSDQFDVLKYKIKHWNNGWIIQFDESIYSFTSRISESHGSLISTLVKDFLVNGGICVESNKMRNFFGEFGKKTIYGYDRRTQKEVRFDTIKIVERRIEYGDIDALRNEAIEIMGVYIDNLERFASKVKELIES